MLGTLYNSEGEMGAGECFTRVNESTIHISATTVESGDELHRSTSGTNVPPTAEEKEKVPHSLASHAKLFSQLTAQWIDKKDHVQATRDEIRKIAQQILLDALASEWLAGDTDTMQVRIYIVDLVLPTLIPGLEKLLMEVEKRDLIETEVPDRNFNPINFLAQYLMRNNPRFSNFSEASPYIRGLRSVAEQLKLELYHATEYKYVNY